MELKEYKEIANYLGLITQVGLTVFVFIFGGVLLGVFLEKKLQTAGWLLAACIIIGISLAFITTYKMLIKK